MTADVSRRDAFRLGGGLLAGGYLAPGLTGTASADPVATTGLPATAVPAAAGRREFTAEIVNDLWPPQRQVWTPIGWKDHLFRFNVFYNGLIACEPGAVVAGKDNVRPYTGLGTQLEFMPPNDFGVVIPPETQPYLLRQKDLGLGEQGWHDSPTPLLWTNWRLKQGLVVRQTVFAHVAGGGPVETAIEPIYAWIRLSVEHIDERSAPASLPFVIRIAKRHVTPTGLFIFRDGVPVRADPAQAPLRGSLHAEPNWSPDGRPIPTRILQGDGRVRLATGPVPPGSVRFAETATKLIYDLMVTLPGRKGAFVDVLMPMLPQPRVEFDRELALGFGGALAESDAFWTRSAERGARIEIPERYMQELVHHSRKFVEVIAEKSPDTGQYTFLTGSFAYDVLWATPSSMSHHMFLDPLGQHETSLKYLELFRHNQGSVKPPGEAYSPHPGYFSTPAPLRAIDWLSDHGAILTSVATNALLSGSSKPGVNQVFLDNWTGPIVKACEFIKDAIEITDHDGIKGLMPPAVATDELLETQGVWSQGWNYKGLAMAVRVLKQIDHPRAAEFDEVRETFRDTLVRAYRDLAAKGPKWTHPDGRRLPVPIADYTPRPPHIFQDAFLLDTGPLFLVFAEVFHADDELMRSAAEFFRVGPNHELWSTQSNAVSRAVLQREISSCEPCYSWNITHSWQLGDREKFLEGMYSLAVAGCSPQTYISNEHRHGIYALMVTAAHAIWCMRQAVVDDLLVEGELHLLRLMPLAWLKSGFETVFENMPTIFGPITLKLTPQGNRLRIEQSASWRDVPKKVVLYVPQGIEELSLNGRTIRVAGMRQVAIEVR